MDAVEAGADDLAVLDVDGGVTVVGNVVVVGFAVVCDVTVVVIGVVVGDVPCVVRLSVDDVPVVIDVCVVAVLPTTDGIGVVVDNLVEVVVAVPPVMDGISVVVDGLVEVVTIEVVAVKAHAVVAAPPPVELEPLVVPVIFGPAVVGLIVVLTPGGLPFLIGFPCTILAALPAVIAAANVPPVLPSLVPGNETRSLVSDPPSLVVVLCFKLESLSLSFFLLGFFMFLTTLPVDFTGARLVLIGMVAVSGPIVALLLVVTLDVTSA